MSAAIAAKVRELSQSLEMTQEDVGNIVGSSARTVGRWYAGVAVPQRDSRQRLLELAYVAGELAKVLRPEDANLWFFSPNVLLEHDTPADRIRKGDYKSVLALIEALADGVVV